MTYRHYRIPGGYQKPLHSLSRSGRYSLPSNYASLPPSAVPESLPLRQTKPESELDLGEPWEDGTLFTDGQGWTDT